MQIDKPTWYLKQSCPCCGQGFPFFCVCPNCGYLTLTCDETGDTFTYLKDLNGGFSDICPRCKEVKTSDFILADSEAIITAGFTTDEYK